MTRRTDNASLEELLALVAGGASPFTRRAATRELERRGPATAAELLSLLEHSRSTNRCVLQDWALSLSYMQQTVLLGAIRGPDSVPKYGPAKMLLRWYRRCVVLSAMDGTVLPTPHAFGGGSFTGPSYEPTNFGHDWRPKMAEIVGQYLRELDAIPHHFQLHFLHAAEILGYKHGDRPIRDWWRETYERLVHDMHLWPETEEQLDRRLGDCRKQWLERNDPATVD